MPAITIAISRAGNTTQAAGTPLQFTVDFSQPVTQVDASAFGLSGTDSSATITSITRIDASHYLVNVAPGTGSGTVELDLIGASIPELAAQPPSFGNFATPVTSAAGAPPETVTLADFNGDGKLDIVTTSSSSSSVSVMLGNGNGTFQAPILPAAGANPGFLAVGDMNGDGKTDIVTTSTDGTLSILRGNGDGTFQAATTSNIGSYAGGIALADVNGDGILDVVTTNIVANTVSISLGNGDGTVRAQTTAATGVTPVFVALADMNGDGKVDIVTSNTSSGTISVLRGNGDGTFQPQTTSFVGVGVAELTLADVNGDGILDIVASVGPTNTVAVLRGNGDGTFQTQTQWAAGVVPRGVAVADINGDGFADIIATSRAGDTVSILRGNGDGTFQPQTPAGTGSQPIGLAVGDVNGDGHTDIVTANYAGNSVSTLLNTALLQSGPAFTIVAPPSGGVPALAFASDSGVAGDQITNVTAPGFTVSLNASAVAGDTVELWLGGAPMAHPLVHTITSAEGNARSVTLFVTPGDLGGDGIKQISARFADALGQSTTTAPVSIRLDTTAAAAPSLALAIDSGSSSTDKITNAGIINVSGLEAGASFEYSVNGGVFSTGNGPQLTFTTDGSYSVVVRQIDSAGNVSVASPALAFTLDTTSPYGPSLTGVVDNTSSFALAGYGEAGSTVRLYEGTKLIGETLVAQNANTWSIASVTLASGLHHLTAQATDLAGNASSLAALTDIYVGTSAGNTLNDGSRPAFMFGRGGNDTYVVNAYDQVVSEGANQGIDTVRTTLADYTLGDNLENLTYTGRDAFSGYGNALANTIIGGAGSDILSGGDGADQLFGGNGNDLLEGGAGADVLNGGSGQDIASYQSATSGVTVNLVTGGTRGDAKGDTYASIEQVYGSEFADSITGSTLADTLYGFGGNDVLDGGLGGNDTLYGGTGRDRFVFHATGAKSSIMDWESGQDKIDLRAFGAAGIHSAANLSISSLDGNAVILAGHTTIVVQGQAGAISRTDFLFG